MARNSRTEEIDPQMRAKLFLSKNLSDVTFIVEGERLPAHRSLLANRCFYFEAMFFGGFSESIKDEIELNVNLSAFKLILQYAYTGKIDIARQTVELMADVICLAHEYGFDELLEPILTMLNDNFQMDTFAIIMNIMKLFNVEQYYGTYLCCIDDKAEYALKHDSFKLLTRDVLRDILTRSSLVADELDIFLGVMTWRETHTDDDFLFIMPHIRFNLMQVDELHKFVKPTDVLELSKLKQIENEIITLSTLPYRGVGTHRNILKRHKLEKIESYGSTWLNNAKVPFKRHGLFELPDVHMINHIQFNVSNIAYGYYVEVSQDGRQWKRIADYTKYECHSEQFLYFDLQPVQYVYIKMFPRYYANRFNQLYQIVSVHTNYKLSSVPMLKKGFVAPICNINRLIAGATDPWQYDSHNALTSRTILNLNGNVMSIFLYQPTYINSIYMKNEEVGNVSKIETAVRRNKFRCLKFQRNYMDKGYFFNPQVVSYIRLTFSERPQVNVSSCVRFFFNPNISQTGSGNDWLSTLGQWSTKS